MDLQDRCPNCFTVTPATPASPCPACGWQPGYDNAAPALPLGLVLNGCYHIGRVLGHGGFGITYLAWDENLSLAVAIKEFLPLTLASRGPDRTSLAVRAGEAREQFAYGLEQFLNEARKLARFEQHPGIVSVKAFFRAHGTGYIVMEYLDGLTLKAYLAQQPGGRIPFATARDILTHVMDALRACHQEDPPLLHRDIAPDNIYLSRGGRIILIDFGAARQAVREQSQALSTIFKPGYAPWEQCRKGGRQGPWTDVYGVAATFYRAITGQTPPEAPDRIDDDLLVPPTKLGIAIPPAAEAVLLKALAVRPGDRTQNIETLQRGLRDGAEPPPPPEPAKPEPPRPPTRARATGKAPPPEPKPRWLVPVLVLLIAIAAGAGGYAWWQSSEPQRLAAMEAASREAEQALADEERRQQAAEAARLEAQRQEQARQAALAAEQKRQAEEAARQRRAAQRQPFEPEMVAIPAGSFLMGSPASEPGRSADEGPQHRVQVAAFALGKTEVTFAQWDACVSDGGCTYRPDDQGWGRGDRPVINVSWNDAQEYLQWLNRKTGKGYRLPSEAEWEYAARAGTTTPFNTGHCITTDQANYHGNYPYQGCDKSAVYLEKTQPVGSYAANRWGLYDLHGNVWEWTGDCWNGSYAGAPADGSAWVAGDCSSRVLRGGSSRNFGRLLRSAFRLYDPPGYRLGGLGLRLAGG